MESGFHGLLREEVLSHKGLPPPNPKLPPAEHYMYFCTVCGMYFRVNEDVFGCPNCCKQEEDRLPNPTSAAGSGE